MLLFYDYILVLKSDLRVSIALRLFVITIKHSMEIEMIRKMRISWNPKILTVVGEDRTEEQEDRRRGRRSDAPQRLG